ncbi:hypothetical protein ACG33_11315 [Steroidobacter denitrificans]|uniref:Outer membrane protein OmpA-like transmembrane domain-containing protein n=1 Tax=Steroidobacter denitrificans TaxID=465721 RepID=A0A127FB89_STEDE|nr:choice-of-anchor U domain-containing protein [Steroidobacter denitrificans]AMN47677.1 hypothetical protein ACG33_11315 [Steroidobacter denitrificans]
MLHEFFQGFVSRYLRSLYVLPTVFAVAAPIEGLAATQCVNPEAPAPLEVCVEDSGAPGVWVDQPNGRWQQYYSGHSWGSLVWLDGLNTSMRFGSGYLGGTPWSTQSNTTTGTGAANDPYVITTIADLGATNVRFTQKISYVNGDRSIRKTWSFENTGETTFDDLRFFHGGDTYFGGQDSARSWYDSGNAMVYVTNSDFTNSGYMGFYPNPATPAARYFSGRYSTGRTQAMAGELSNTADSSFLDAGYVLQWNRATLAPGETWTFEGFETWSAPGELQVFSPADEYVLSGTTVHKTFKIQNLTEEGLTAGITVTASAGWTATLSEEATITLAALEVGEILVDVQVPAEAGAGASSDITVSTTGAIVTSAATRLSVLQTDYVISPTTLDFGIVPVGSTADLVVTMSNDASGLPVAIGRIAEANQLAAPYSIVADQCSATTLAAGEECAVTVRYTSTTTAATLDSFSWPILAPVITSQTISTRSSEIPSTHVVTASAESNGTITPATANIAHGERAVFTLTPAVGYSIAAVSGCAGTLSGTTYTTAAITGACSVSAGFSSTLPAFSPGVAQPLELETDALTTQLPQSLWPQATDYAGTKLEVTLLNPQPRYLPGEHVLTWRAVDQRGVESIVQQTLRVWPTVSLGKDVILGYRQGNSGSFKVVLNGPSPVYPYVVDYQVSGDAQHHDLADGSVRFEQGEVEKDVYFAIVGAPASDAPEQQIQVSLADDVNAGGRSSLTVTLTSANAAPAVHLHAFQDDETPAAFGRAGGVITVRADVRDPNSEDTHTVQWISPSGAVVTTLGEVLTLQPQSLAVGIHRFEAVVTDNGSPALASRGTIDLVLAEQAAVLPQGASAWLDNGLPDHPAYSLPMRNVVPERARELHYYLLEAEPGVQLRLGPLALLAAASQAEVQLDDSALVPPDTVGNVGGYFDFVVNELPKVGQSVSIVLPQRRVIPSQAVYRKYDPAAQHWFTFVENASNALASAPGAPGLCPSPNSDEFRAGLNAGDWCVRLTIEDGGPNDTDGQPNGAISDPGGVGATASVIVEGRGGGGSMHPLLVLLFAGMLVWRQRARILLIAGGIAGATGLVSAAASADDATPYWYGAAHLAQTQGGTGNAGLTATLQTQGYDVTATIDDRKRLAWRIRGGYQWTKFLGAELGYADLGNVESTIAGNVVDVQALLASTTATHPRSANGFEAALVARYPMGELFALTARAGGWRWDSSYRARNVAGEFRRHKRTGSDALYGMGVQIGPWAQWSAALDWTHYRLERERIDVLGGGLVYRFR